jgi:hypothetical protein
MEGDNNDKMGRSPEIADIGNFLGTLDSTGLAMVARIQRVGGENIDWDAVVAVLNLDHFEVENVKDAILGYDLNHNNKSY